MIKIFSTNCVKCKEAERAAKNNNIEFEVESDLDIVLSEAAKYNVLEAPFSIINGAVYKGQDLVNFLKGE